MDDDDDGTPPSLVDAGAIGTTSQTDDIPLVKVPITIVTGE